MVIEHFGEREEEIGERFRRKGRMLPDGVVYIDSWIDGAGKRCFQLMEAPDRAALDRWIDRWSDLVRFEVTPVKASADYWADRSRSG